MQPAHQLRDTKDPSMAVSGSNKADRPAGRPGCCTRARFALIARRIGKSPWYHKLFVALVICQVVCTIIERGLLLYNGIQSLQSMNTDSELYENTLRQQVWFCVILTLSAAFIGYFGIHAIIATNAFEILAFFFACLFLLIRITAEYISDVAECRNSEANSGSPICLASVIVSAVLCTANTALCVAMFKDLRWIRYKAIGAEVSTRMLYAKLELFMAIKMLDLQFAVITLITGWIFFSTAHSNTANVGIVLAVILFFVEIAWERAGDRAVYHESKTAMYIFWTLSIFLPAFIINVTVDYFRQNELLRSADNQLVLITIATFAILTLLNRVATVINSVVLYKSFGEKYRGVRRLLAGDRIRRFERTRVRARLPEKTDKVISNPLQLAHQQSAARLAMDHPLAGADGSEMEVVTEEVVDWDDDYYIDDYNDRPHKHVEMSTLTRQTPS